MRAQFEVLESRQLLSLVAAYGFDEGAGTLVHDVSGTGNDGAVNNVLWSAAGKFGGAMQFAGATNSFVQVADNPSFHLASGMTLEAWVRPSSLNSPDNGWCAAIAKDHRNSSNDISYALYSARGNNTPPSSHIQVGQTDYGTTGGTRLSLNTWYFLASTYDGKTLRTYVNGTQIGSKNITGTIAVTTDALKIGGDWSGEMFTGLIDNVRIYNSALAQAAIQTDMNTAVVPPVQDTQPPTAPSNVVAAGSLGQVNLSWGASSDDVGVTGYQVYRSTSSGFTPSVSNQIATTTALSYRDTVAPGTYYYLVTATDAAGNQSAASNEASGVSAADQTPPSVAITAPADGSTISGTVSVSASASDNVGVVGVQFQLDGSNLGAEDASAPYTISWNTTGLSGPHSLTAIARDAVGNSATSLVTTVTVDNADHTPPTVSLTAPANNSTAKGAVNVAASASDNVGVIGVQFQINGADLGSEDLTSPYQVSWDTTAYPNDTYTLTAVARDAAGNKTTSAVRSVIVNNPTTDPAAVGQWSPVMDWPLVAINMALLDTGKILMWDGGPDCIGAISATVWDPATNTFTPTPSETQQEVRDIFCSALTVLADGKVLVAGGHECLDPSFVGSAIGNLFDPATQTWTKLPDMNYRRWYPTATTLPDGRALVTAGADTGNLAYIPIPEIYDEQTNTWTKLTSANRTIPDYPFMFVLPDGRVIAAGSDEAKMATSVLDLKTQTWTTVDPTILDAGSAVMYLPGKIMKAGSSYLSDPADNGGNIPSAATTYVLDTTGANPIWQQTASMANARTHLNLTVLPDGNVIATGGSSVIGGINPATAVYAAEMWSPTTQTWTTMASEQISRMYHSTALLLPDGRVLVAGSGHNYANSYAEYNAEIYSPPYLFKGARPTITSSPTSDIGYGSSFFVGTPDASDIASVSLIRSGAVTHSFNMDQRYVPLSFQQTAGGLTVTAPPDANTAPPGYYMLWIVNSRGVPSIAPFVHFAPDQQAPTAPQSMTAQGAIGQVTLNWLASTDNVGIAQYTIYRSTTPNFTPSASNRIGQTTATSYLDSSLPAGTYYYEVTAQDAVGNVSPASNQVTAVSAAPPIHVVQHAANGFESNVSQISLAFPGSVTAGDFLIITGTAARPREQITISDSAGNTFVPAFGPVSDPAQDVTAYVWYVVNARGGPDTITLTPVGGPDAMEIHISEWTGINQVSPIDRVSSATGNGTQITSGTKTTTQNGELIFGYTFPNQNATAGAGFTGLSLINGDLDEYQIQNTAGPIAATWTQAADNWFGVMVTFRAADADTEPPTAPSSLTANGGLGTAALSWAAATDNLAVDHYNIYRSTTSGSAGALVGQSNITSFTDGGLAAGTYYYTVVAVDGAGNTSSASNQASALVTADMVPPSVAIFSPADGATVSGAVQLSATATDDVGVASVTFYVDGIQIGAPVTSAPYAITWGSAGVANGSHVLTATAKDLSGNPTTSDAITVNVQNVVTGLVASYSFDEGAGNTLNDQSGNGNNGSVNNATWSSGGRYGGALLFTGSTSSFVQIASSAALQLTKGMTLEAWVNPSSLASPDGGWCAVIAKDHANSSNDIAYALYAAQGTNTGPSGHILVSSRDYGTTGGSKLALNGWAFLTVTYNGSVLSTYLNGVLLGSKSISGSIFTGADPLKIGGDWSGEMFTGLIDNVRLYNRALSATEIQSDMATAVPTASSGGGGSQAGEAATVAAALPASSSAASPTPAPMFSTLRVSRRDLDSLLDRHRRHRRR